MMGYVEAFKKLGFTLANPRSSVSAEGPAGIALAIFRSEISKGVFNTRAVPDWVETRGHLRGNKQRISHLERAVSEFGGRVSVVLVDGDAGKSHKTAEPWERLDTYWLVTDFDPATGHHRVELHREDADGVYPNPTRIPRTKSEMWKVLKEQFEYVETILGETPIQQREDVENPDRAWEPGTFISYRGTSKDFDNRDDFLQRSFDLLPYIARAISEKRLTPEFVQKWGMIMYYHGYIASYVLDDSDSTVQLRGGLAVAKKAKAKRKFIANLMVPLIDQKFSRQEAQDQVLERLKRIIRRKEYPPKFDHTWFASLLGKNGLSATYDDRHFSVSDMRRLCFESTDDIPSLTLGIP